ncbi:MAG: hypothetical protein JXR60_02260 [Bacteroidales bacterium]|nr:hypothetical protein [Bacteroidales bacterium]
MKKINLLLTGLSLLFIAACQHSQNSDEIVVEEQIEIPIAEEVETIVAPIENYELMFDKWWDDTTQYGAADQFFGKDGVFNTDFGNPGTWKWGEEGRSLVITDNGQEVIYNLIEVTENTLKVNIRGGEYSFVTKQQ